MIHFTDDDEFEPESIAAVAKEITGISLEDKFKDEDVEDADEAKIKKGNTGSAKKGGSSAKKGIKTSNVASPASNDNGEPMDRAKQIKMQIESDLNNASALFGTDKNLETFIPEDAKEYEAYGAMVAYKYLLKV